MDKQYGWGHSVSHIYDYLLYYRNKIYFMEYINVLFLANHLQILYGNCSKISDTLCSQICWFSDLEFTKCLSE